jgi:hypothetical protein
MRTVLGCASVRVCRTWHCLIERINLYIVALNEATCLHAIANWIRMAWRWNLRRCLEACLQLLLLRIARKAIRLAPTNGPKYDTHFAIIGSLQYKRVRT